MKVFYGYAGPRINKNTHNLMNSFIEGFSTNYPSAEIFDAKLYDKEIGYCTGCDGCLYGEKTCIIKDDMQDLYSHVVDSDVLVLGAPTYWFNIAAQLKTFIDRLYALPSGSLHGKSIVYITTFGDTDEKVSGAYNGMSSMKDMSDYCGAKFYTVYASTEVMDIENNVEAKAAAHEAGEKLAEELKIKN